MMAKKKKAFHLLNPNCVISKTVNILLNMTDIGNGTGQPRGVGKLTRTLTREDRVLNLTG